MNRFDSCDTCIKLPRILYGSSERDDVGAKRMAMTAQLTDLGLDLCVDHYWYKCPNCGTYYRFEVDLHPQYIQIPISTRVLRLIRVTHVEAETTFQEFEHEQSRSGEESRWTKQIYSSRMTEMAEALHAPVAMARNFAAETLTDDFKRSKQIDKVRELLNHPDPDVQMGALWSFAEPPMQEYSMDSPRCRTFVTSGDKKPFIKPGLIFRELAMLTCAPEPRIRSVAESLLREQTSEEGYLKALLAVPAERRSTEFKRLHIACLWATSSQGAQELVAYLGDETPEIRNEALRQVYNSCDRPTFVDIVKAEIHKVPVKSRSDQMKFFLKDPERGFYSDDDD